MCEEKPREKKGRCWGEKDKKEIEEEDKKCTRKTKRYKPRP